MGPPKKYITGCFAEGEMAVEHFLSDIPDMPKTFEHDNQYLFNALHKEKGIHFTDVEDRLQKIMDEYGGGFSMNYGTNDQRLSMGPFHA